MATITEASTSRFVQVEDGQQKFNVHYNDAGSGAETIVLLHGSGPGASGWANYSNNVEALVNAGFRVLLVDVPGWGKSDTVVISKGTRSDFNGRILHAVLDALNIGKVHILGNSMGGHSAVSFALEHPQRVGKLVLMGGGTGGPGVLTPMPAEGIKLLNLLYREPTIENLKRMMNVFVYDASTITEELMQTRLNNMLARRDHLESFVKSQQVNSKLYSDYRARLSEIKAPTLVVWGREDRFVPLDIALHLIAGIPDAQLHVFNRCGHWVQWEHAEKFNRMVIDFLVH